MTYTRFLKYMTVAMLPAFYVVFGIFLYSGQSITAGQLFEAGAVSYAGLALAALLIAGIRKAVLNLSRA